MNRHLFSAILISGIIACGAALFFMISPSADPAPRPAVLRLDGDMVAYVAQANLLEPHFREPFETSVMIFPNYDIAMWSTHHEGAIFGAAEERINYLKSIGRRIEDVVAIVHNHHLPGGFSRDGDDDFIRNLRQHGFIGRYGIYETFRKKDPIIWMDEEK